jgi:hypothetical protein
LTPDLSDSVYKQHKYRRFERFFFFLSFTSDEVVDAVDERLLVVSYFLATITTVKTIIKLSTKQTIKTNIGK